MTKTIFRHSFVALVCLGIAASVACSSSAPDDGAGVASAVEAVDVDLGCPPAPAFCPAETPDPTGLVPATDVAPLNTSLHILADKPDAEDFEATCLTKLKALTGKAVQTVKVCAYSFAVCAAIFGNPNGTALQKFCSKAATLVNCKGAAKNEAAERNIEGEICKSCSSTAACSDGGAEAGASEAGTKPPPKPAASTTPSKPTKPGK